MTDDPAERSTTTTRRSPDVVGSRPPSLDGARALRRAAVLAAVIAVVVLVFVVRGDDDGPTFAGPAAGDPVSALCRSVSVDERSVCETAYFDCRSRRTEILDDASLPRTARPRRIAVAYVTKGWSDWDPPAQRAAELGCRGGLRR